MDYVKHLSHCAEATLGTHFAIRLRSYCTI